MLAPRKGAWVVSALAANRAAFFRLVGELEREAGCRVDTVMLEAVIDSTYPGRESLTPAEAMDVIRAASKSEAPR